MPERREWRPLYGESLDDLPMSGIVLPRDSDHAERINNRLNKRRVSLNHRARRRYEDYKRT